MLELFFALDVLQRGNRLGVLFQLDVTQALVVFRQRYKTVCWIFRDKFLPTFGRCVEQVVVLDCDDAVEFRRSGIPLLGHDPPAEWTRGGEK